MSKRYLTEVEDGILAITTIVGDDPDGSQLTKTLFEISRTTDKTVQFNPEVHTREAIAAGIDGHKPLPLLGECEDTDLPTDLYFRNAWEWSD